MTRLGHSAARVSSVTLVRTMRASDEPQTRRSRRRRSLAHQCPHCRALWALTVVLHPSGPVVRCRHCGHARAQRAGAEEPVLQLV
jgi:Zn ribbon nucleic-acid-binding protein